MIWQFTLKGTKDDIYGLCEVLEDQSDVMSVFEDADDECVWLLVGTCEGMPDKALLQEKINAYGTKEPVVLEMHQLPDRDWLAENRKAFPPLAIAGFYIYGSHVENPQDDPSYKSSIPLKIDASTAFGTGNHGTTHGCLAALQAVKKMGFIPSNPFDLGCGTGILAMAIAKLFDRPVLATDMDATAVEKTLYNAKENGVGDLIQARVVEGLEGPVIMHQAPFDLIAANILAGPLIELAPDLKNVLQAEGYLILSGILDYQGADVKEAYLDGQLELVHEQVLEGWVTFIFRKTPKEEASKDRVDFSIQIQG